MAASDDKLIEQLNLVTSLTGNEDVVIAVNGRAARVKAGLLKIAGASFTAESIGLGEVDNTPDLDKPISTKVSEALELKADKSALANLVTTDLLTLAVGDKADKAALEDLVTDEELTLAIDTKADKAALDALVTKSIFDEALLLKADKSELSDLVTISAFNGALADKLNSTVFVDYSAAAAIQLAKIDEKAEAAHTHAYHDISDLVQLIDYIKAALRPIPTTADSNVTDTSAQIGVDITNVNGYNLDGVYIKLEYKADADTDWTVTPTITANNGTTHYTASITGLLPLTHYSVKLTLVDSNSPESLTQATVFDFTTLAAAPL